MVGHTRVALIDPGPPGAEQLTGLSDMVGERTVEAVLLTHAHRDHAGLAEQAAARFEARVMASRDTLRRLGLSGVELSDGDAVPLDSGELKLTAFAAPGHSSDHLAFFVEPGRSLFTGDLVLGAGSSAVLYPDGDVGACLTSFERLLALEPERLFPGHGPPVQDAAGRLEQYREHRLERHAEVVAAVRQGNRTVAELRAAVYGSLESGLVAAAEASVRAHLAWMRQSGEDTTGIADFNPAGGSCHEAVEQ